MAASCISSTHIVPGAVGVNQLVNGCVSLEKLNLDTIDPHYVNAEGDVVTGNLIMTGTNSIINVHGIILSTNSGDVGMGIYTVKP
jgi:hypothetical protein